LASDPNFYELCELLVFSTLSIDPGRNLKLVASGFEKARLIIVVSAWERLELKLSAGAARRKCKPNPGRNLKLVASGFEEATIYDIFAIFAVGKLSINYSLNHILRN